MPPGLDLPEPAAPVRPEVTVAVRAGATRLLIHHGHAPVWEFALANGRRADICGVDPRGEVAIVEVKSGVEDFRADGKWPDYEPYCDRFYFAVAPAFPQELLPGHCGLIVADAFGAEIIRPAPLHALAPARRKAMLVSLARHAAFRALRAG